MMVPVMRKTNEISKERTITASLSPSTYTENENDSLDAMITDGYSLMLHL